MHIHLNTAVKKSNDAEIIEVESKMEEEKSVRENIIDIKQITNKMWPYKGIKLINEAIKFYDYSDSNPFKTNHIASKLLIKQMTCVENFDDIEQTFIDRKRRHKLTPNQIKYIVTLLDDSSLSISKISQKYKISKSLIHKIKHIKSRDYESRINQFVNKFYGVEKILIIQWIKFFVENRSYPYILKDAKSYVYQNIGRYYSYKLLYTQ